jgi:transcriptional regulator with XRE-family HTH domain
MRIRTAEDLGARIRARRKAKGLTQTQAAEIAGVSLRFLSELERGRATAGVGLALRVCERLALNISVINREDDP